MREKSLGQQPKSSFFITSGCINVAKCLSCICQERASDVIFTLIPLKKKAHWEHLGKWICKGKANETCSKHNEKE